MTWRNSALIVKPARDRWQFSGCLAHLDYFEARYFSGAQGRFTRPDPLFIRYSRLADPQSLNLYAYGRNNPLNYTDPLGMEVFVTGEYTDEYLKQGRQQKLQPIHRNAPA